MAVAALVGVDVRAGEAVPDAVTDAVAETEGDADGAATSGPPRRVLSATTRATTASSATPMKAIPLDDIGYRIVSPRALATSSTASAAVRLLSSRIGFTSAISMERSFPDAASISIASCASR